MPNITVCSGCGNIYEAGSEEQANVPLWHEPRLCPSCVQRDREKNECTSS